MCPERRASLRLRRHTLTNTTKEAQCQQLHMTFATIRVPPTPIACQRSQQNIGPQLLTRSHRSRPVCGCQIARAVVARRGRFHRGGAPWRRCWCSSKGEVGVSPNRAGTRPLGLSLARESKRVGVPLEPGRCSTNSHWLRIMGSRRHEPAHPHRSRANPVHSERAAPIALLMGVRSKPSTHLNRRNRPLNRTEGHANPCASAAPDGLCDGPHYGGLGAR